jgi:protein-tyrosine phosphatase
MRAITRASLALLVVTAGAAAVAQPPRPAIAAPTAAAHERLLPLQGGRNFRDLGGYATEDGRHVRWGMLYRSGSMHDLTPADYAALQRRGIRIVCDLRDTRERSAEPVHWPTTGAPQVLSDDYALDPRDFLPAAPMKDWTAYSARAAMTASYPKMLVQFRNQYRRMFAELLAGHAPLAFNCSAGKDRTGIAAALLLTALGVPRQTVIDDYLLTNRYLARPSCSPARRRPTARGRICRRGSPPRWRPPTGAISKRRWPFSTGIPMVQPAGCAMKWDCRRRISPACARCI